MPVLFKNILYFYNFYVMEWNTCNLYIEFKLLYKFRIVALKKKKNSNYKYNWYIEI